ncbi:MAG TPA: Flp family type IVb pilin [Candidatus Polarisedimenticolia bacterium]|nr:Flp family type IVb pilin [Candidatus Polarisedimenticolia bacterium]
MFRQRISRLFPGDLLARTEGQDLAEYGMLAALIAVVVIVALVTVGNGLASLWGNITTAFAALS